ncbi:addiction module antidote protein [Pseudoxanthomonas sp. z9]|uniref:addiction module antidote protein n=1 Tax=Pseudoxanthomonas sp. z9 TaxID=2584942 RepID=UPI001144CA8D|nr:addiction module antidote protein [Pseudoxanthomonas sp. z9]
MSAKIKTRPWDAAEHLRDEEDIRRYIEAALEEAPDDASFLAAVLGDVARAQNMAKLSRDTGIARETLYKVMRGEGNPTLETVGKMAKALGFRLTLTPIKRETPVTKKPVAARKAVRKRKSAVQDTVEILTSKAKKKPAPIVRRVAGG